jgi:hypothetical protein
MAQQADYPFSSALILTNVGNHSIKTAYIYI